MSFDPPPYAPWQVHRVATSGRYNDSLHTILTEWGLADLHDANAMLDALDEARSRPQREG